ncbi:MAG: YwiC-like family protein [Aggregatilineales bacterium]
MSASIPRTRSSWRSAVLPTEHGGWGFLFEPILLGLLVAFSWPGVALSVAAINIFLLQQPLKTALRDRLRSRYYARTALAERFAVLFGTLAFLSGVLALLTAQGDFLIPIMLAAPLALLQVSYAVRNRGREALAEISGAWALGASAPTIGLAGGLALPTAFLLWFIIGWRALISILYVRVRLRRARQEPARLEAALLLHALALVVFVGLWLLNVTGAALPIAFGILLARAAKGLLAPRAVPTKVIGFSELGCGILVAILAAVAV